MLENFAENKLFIIAYALQSVFTLQTICLKKQPKKIRLTYNNTLGGIGALCCIQPGPYHGIHWNVNNP